METKEAKSMLNDVLSNSKSLVKTLSENRGQRKYNKIGIEIVKNTDDYKGSKSNDEEQQTSTSNLIITIEADTQAHAEEHAQELTDQGCICTSTGETTVECDCTGL